MAESHTHHSQMIELREHRDIDNLKPLVARHNRRALEAYQTLLTG
jgi:hypothetical protein